MNYKVCKRQYGSLTWYNFSFLKDIVKEEILQELIEGDGYYGVIDVYTDDKDCLEEEVRYKDWYTDEDGNPKDKVFFMPTEKLRDKYGFRSDSIMFHPMAELPEDTEDKPEDDEIVSIINR